MVEPCEPVPIPLPGALPRGPTHLEPAGVEKELQQGEDGHAQVQVVAFVALSWVQELATDEAGQEVAVHSYGHHLGGGVGHQVRVLPVSGGPGEPRTRTGHH